MAEQVKSCETCEYDDPEIMGAECVECYDYTHYQPKEQEVMPLVTDRDLFMDYFHDGPDPTREGEDVEEWAQTNIASQMKEAAKDQRNADQKWHDDKLEAKKREWAKKEAEWLLGLALVVCKDCDPTMAASEDCGAFDSCGISRRIQNHRAELRKEAGG